MHNLGNGYWVVKEANFIKILEEVNSDDHVYELAGEFPIDLAPRLQEILGQILTV